MKKTISNIFYNMIYQVFLVLIPLITVPYLSRVLGPQRYGIYSYVKFSIQFLMVIAAVALSYIGTRTIAKLRLKNDQKEITRAFWGLWYFQVVASLLIMGLLLIAVLVLGERLQYGNYFYLQMPFLLATLFDIAWFFQGLSEFGKVVLRNTLVKLTAVILIFIFVKTPDDLWKYMLIMSVTTLLGSLVFWLNINQYVGKPTKHFYELKTTAITIVTLLVPQVANQVYTTLDKPILGALSNATEVAYYANAQRITTLILGVVTAITVVLMPKMVGLKSRAQEYYVKKTVEITLLLSLLFIVIIMVNTSEFVPFFFGDQFAPVANLMFFSTLTILFIPLGAVFANQFALANHKDKEFAIPLLVGAALSLVLSFFLDRQYGAAGAMFTVIFVEFVVAVLRIWVVRKVIDVKKVFAELPKYLLLAALTYVVGSLLPQLSSIRFWNMMAKSLIMMLLYFAVFLGTKFELKKDVLKLGRVIFARFYK